MDHPNIVIIGSGIAGAAAAYGLARRGIRNITILEREFAPGAHASGRNASLVRRNLKTPSDCKLSLAATNWFQNPAAGFPRDPEFRKTGSLLLFQQSASANIDREFEIQRAAGLEFEILNSRETLQKQPLLNASAFDHAQWTPGDGLLNIINLLYGFLEYACSRGARLVTGTKVQSFIIDNNGNCRGARTTRGEFPADIVINAAGAWANSLLPEFLPALEMTPCRRTMLVTKNIGANPAHPFTWDDGKGFYFREDHGGLLWSPCDEVPSPDCKETVDPAWVERARIVARELIPSVASTPIHYQWGCLRTLTFDREMFIGPEPRLPGLFWVAGLGGHGITNSPLIAEIVADLILSGTTTVLPPNSIAPRRPTSKS